MKLLALADIHGDVERLYQLANGLEEKPDAVVVAGDLTPFGPAGLVPRVKEALDSFSKYVFMIPGNEDTREVRAEMDRLGVNMHNKHLRVKDATLVGFEGARWIDADGEVFMKYDPVHEVLREAKGKKVLVTHVPPFDTEADMLWTGHHVGSPFLRALIEDYQPDFVVCGHIHESRAVDKLGRTTVVNTGALADGYAAWIDTDTKAVEFLHVDKKGVKKIAEPMKARSR
jgi:Icc-related predicted phosphoesterase